LILVQGAYGMKRLYFVLVLFVGAFVFFSFLAKTDKRNADLEGLEDQKDIFVFYEENLHGSDVVVEDVTQQLEKLGCSVRSYSFDPAEIVRFVLSHPDALFITKQPVECTLYEMEQFSYLLVKVAVSKDSFSNLRLTGEEFDDLLHKRGLLSGSARGIRIISFQELTLEQYPLPVDGIQPSIYNIRTARYSKIYRAYLQVMKGGIFDSRVGERLLDDFGGWLDRSFSIIAGGDIMLARGTGKYMEKYGFCYPFLEVAAEIGKHDIAVANLESPLSSSGKMFYPFKGIYFRANPEAVTGLTCSGLDVLTLANNHALDWGVDGILDTMEILRREGIQHTGVGSSRNEALKPALVNVGGINVAFLAYNDIYPYAVNEAGTRMMTLSIDKDSIKREIGKIQDMCDILVVFVHSGTEYITHPEAEKVEKFRFFVDCGADVVIGTHPHVIQDIELYRGGLIAYSLGNLIFDQNWSKDTSLGLLLEISFIGECPVYYDPQVVYIQNAQARIITDGVAKAVLSSLYSERRGYAYAKR
jgi:poly-gamma-glutamate capsule biosynthesis protein CapA/YwtB (metallophosphatase superfamily)